MRYISGYLVLQSGRLVDLASMDSGCCALSCRGGCRQTRSDVPVFRLLWPAVTRTEQTEVHHAQDRHPQHSCYNHCKSLQWLPLTSEYCCSAGGACGCMRTHPDALEKRRPRCCGHCTARQSSAPPVARCTRLTRYDARVTQHLHTHRRYRRHKSAPINATAKGSERAHAVHAAVRSRAACSIMHAQALLQSSRGA
jgi:hypothetical protein